LAKRTRHKKEREDQSLPLREADEIVTDSPWDLVVNSGGTVDLTDERNLEPFALGKGSGKKGQPDTEASASSGELVRHDPLQSYLAEIRHIPTLTREQETALANRYKLHGDKQAALKLVVANLRLVVMIAREHQRNIQNILDLVQEGNIGLLEAVEKYDPSRGIRFPSYAVYWIRAYILRYLINNIRLVKVGTTQAQRKLFFNLVKEKEKLENEGFVPEAKLLADRLGVKESEVIEMEKRLRLPDLSVDAPVNRGEEDSLDLHSIIPSNIEDQESVVADEDFKSAIREVVDRYKDKADEKEKAIIDLRLLSDEPLTLQEIADKFNISRERIRQIESRLKTRLKALMEDRLDLSEDGTIDINNEEN